MVCGLFLCLPPCFYCLRVFLSLLFVYVHFGEIYVQIYVQKNMGTVTKRARKRGAVYVAEVCVSGIRKSATFDTKSEAHRWAEEAESLLRDGKPLPGEQPADDLDFAEAVNKYAHLAGKRRKANTRAMYEYCAVRLTRYFAGRTLKGIERKDIAAYRDYRMQHVGPASIIHDFSFLRGMYRTARVEWGLDVGNPVEDVSPPSPPKHRLVLLTPDEITRLLQACLASTSPKLHNYVLLMLHTAMRPSEAAGLRWQQVLFDDSMLDLTITKTDPRRVPLTPTALEMLKSMRKVADTETVFLPVDRRPGPIPSHFFRRAFGTACKRAGIEDFTLYGLRHSAASYLIMNGVDIRTVAEIMGHRNIQQTMKYTHFLDAHKVAAISAIDKLGK